MEEGTCIHCSIGSVFFLHNSRSEGQSPYSRDGFQHSLFSFPFAWLARYVQTHGPAVYTAHVLKGQHVVTKPQILGDNPSEQPSWCGLFCNLKPQNANAWLSSAFTRCFCKPKPGTQHMHGMCTCYWKKHFM